MNKFFQTTKRIVIITIWALKFQYQSLGWGSVLLVIRHIYDNLQALFYSFFLGRLINVLIQWQQISQGSLETSFGLPHLVTQPLLMIIGIWLLGHILHFDDYVFSYWRHNRSRIYFYRTILNKIVYLDWERIEEPETEKMIRSILDNGNWPFHRFFDGVLYLVTIAIAFVFALQTVEMTWLLILALLVGAIPKGLQTFYYTYIDSRLYESVLPRYVKIAGVMDFFRSFNTIFESKVSQAEHKLQQIDEQERQQIMTTYLVRFKKLLWVNILTISTSFSSNIYILWVLVRQVVNQGLPIGTFQYYVTAFNKLRSDMTAIFTSFGELEDAYRFLWYSHQFLHLEPKLSDGSKVISLSSPPKIEFRDVWFKYPRTSDWVIKNVNVVINPGEKLALVGENGAGKSTFVRLLLRAYDVSKGQILIDGTDIKDLKKESWYKLISLITQDFARYDVLSVAENIDLSSNKYKNEANQLRVQQTAELVQAHKFIQRLPKKYQTILSKKLAGGTELSTGQWQKLALARLFYADSQVVVLDEPTASIDPVAEHKIFQNVSHQLKDKTVVLVSHRYTTIQGADKILVFKEGEIVEQGTHGELMKLDGSFAHAYKLQHQQKKI